MRFLQFEHRDIMNAIAAAGLDSKDFNSVKRQGKLHLFYRGHPVPFKFFRKKETRLNAGKWEQLTIYLVYRDGNSTELNSWDEVMISFREWLEEVAPAS